MARQRFIHPEIWDDPDLGQATPLAFILYVGCFSNADDDGRLLGNTAYLKTQMFRYRPEVTLDDVLSARAELVAACRSFVVYEHNHTEYIAFLNWPEYQKPQYPKPSKLPPPPGWKRRKPSKQSQKSSMKDSSKASMNDSMKGSTKDSLVGWVGLGSTPLPPSGTHPTGAGRGNTRMRKPKAAQRHRTALAQATKLAAGWTGSLDSDTFALAIDELQLDTGITLGALERETLWDIAAAASADGHQPPAPPTLAGRTSQPPAPPRPPKETTHA